MKLVYNLMLHTFLLVQGAYAGPQKAFSFQGFLDSIQNQEAKNVSLKEYKHLYEVFLKDLTSSTEQPKLIIFSGGPGAGKTTYRKKYFENLNNFHIHDMDEVLVHLKGYQKDLQNYGAKTAFENWWPTAQTIANQFVRYAFSHRLNVIYDRTCGTETSLSDLKHAIENLGYHAVMYAFTLPEKETLQRVRKRSKTEGRVVTDEIVREYAKRFSALFPKYKNFIDEVHLFLGPHEIYAQKNFQEDMKDKEQYDLFLNTGLEYKK